MSIKKVTFLIWRDQPGGIEVLLPVIKNKLNNFIFSAFIFRKIKTNQISVFDETDISRIYASDKNLFLLKDIYLFIKCNLNSIYHGFNIGPYILFLIRLTGIKKVIYSIHGTKYWKTKLEKFIRQIFWKLSLSNNLIFTANSEYSKKVFLETVSSKPNIKVLYNPIDLNRFNIKGRTEIDIKKLKIFYVGRLTNGKNLFNWVQLAEFLLKENPEFKFRIYGDGPLKNELNDFIVTKNLGGKVSLMGFHKDIENVYRENDILIFLSEYESFGNVAVESILCGKPVIVSDIPSMREIFTNYPEFLVPLNDNLYSNILDKIIHLKSLQSLTINAATEFKNRFSIEKHIRELNNIYKSFE